MASICSVFGVSQCIFFGFVDHLSGLERNLYTTTHPTFLPHFAVASVVTSLLHLRPQKGGIHEVVLLPLPSVTVLVAAAVVNVVVICYICGCCSSTNKSRLGSLRPPCEINRFWKKARLKGQPKGGLDSLYTSGSSHI